MDAYDTYLVLAFVGETRVLGINAEEELDEAEIPGFDAAAQVWNCYGDLLGVEGGCMGSGRAIVACGFGGCWRTQKSSGYGDRPGGEQ